MTNSTIFAQRYVDGRSLLRYLPLFNTMNDTLNFPSCLPKALRTYGKRAAKKGGKVVTCAATKLNCGIVPLPQKFRKPVRTREFYVGSNGIFFFFAPRFDAAVLRSSPRLLATAQNTNCQVRLRGLWAMADALCAESWCTVCSTVCSLWLPEWRHPE